MKHFSPLETAPKRSVPRREARWNRWAIGPPLSTKPIRIGILLPFTGPFGIYGNPMETTLKARFAKVGSKVNGRPIELVFEDEATDAKTAVSKATKLIERKHVNAIVCCILK